MERIIRWEKEPPNRYFQRKFIKYIFKENDVEIGFFQIRGTLNLEIYGKFLEQDIEFRYRRSSKNRISTSFDIELLDNVSKKRLAYITGSMAISVFKKYERIISVNENQNYVFCPQMDVIVRNEKDDIGQISCVYKNSKSGKLICKESMGGTLFLATFVSLHHFMELNESN